METIQPVRFVSVHEALSGAPTDVIGVIKSTSIVPVEVRPSTRYPQGVSLLGYYYSSAVLDEIDADQFWDGLPSIGKDHEQRVERIRAMFPVTHLSPDPRGNRRKLYAEITWLRNESSIGWEFDKHQERRTNRNETRSIHLVG